MNNTNNTNHQCLIEGINNCLYAKNEFFKTKEKEVFFEAKEKFTKAILNCLKAGVEPTFLVNLCDGNERMIKKIEEKYTKLFKRNEIGTENVVNYRLSKLKDIINDFAKQDSLIKKNEFHSKFKESKKGYKQIIERLNADGILMKEIIGVIKTIDEKMAKKVEKKYSDIGTRGEKVKV